MEMGANTLLVPPLGALPPALWPAAAAHTGCVGAAGVPAAPPPAPAGGLTGTASPCTSGGIESLSSLSDMLTEPLTLL
jgi:hypothetical protein